MKTKARVVLVKKERKVKAQKLIYLATKEN